MKRIVLIIAILVMCSIYLVKPFNAYATPTNNKNSIIYTGNVIHSLDKKNNNQVNCESLLGDPTKEESVAWLIQQILNYLKYLGPLIVLILSSVDFAKAIIMSDDENMKKAQKKLITRLLAVVLLFFIPNLVTVILEVFGLTTNPTCGLG